MAEVLKVKIRDTRGTGRMRRLRAVGNIPAVLYGHGEANVSLSVPADQLSAAIRHGTHLVTLEGEITDTALIREVQWDSLGIGVLHVDFTRVRAGESVELSITVELRGEAPGTKEGGIIEQLLYSVDIDCPVAAIPEKFEIRLNALALGGTIFVKDIPLPEGAKLLSDPEAVVVQCVTPMAVEEEAVPGAETAEPEVIGKKPDEEEGEEE
jgi:large subunit ribosomal protein L25